MFQGGKVVKYVNRGAGLAMISAGLIIITKE
jgi:hypothetical protein